MHLARTPDGYRFDYAIADVGAFVRPGGAIDRESHAARRDALLPRHPHAALPGRAVRGRRPACCPTRTRPAVLWSFDLDQPRRAGAHVGPPGPRPQPAAPRLRRRCRRMLDGGADVPEPLALLREIGLLRQQRERERGGVSLDVPEQEVNGDPAGGWRLEFRATLPCEDWNAQLSLLTGMAAARLMLDGGVGLLRTLPPPWPLRGGVAAPVGAGAGSRLAAAQRRTPTSSAASTATSRRRPRSSRWQRFCCAARATSAFDGAPPEQPLHSAVAAPYAHATAPLRRLADRYVSEVCLALSAGVPVPDWARSQLPALPALMAAADHRSHELERAMIDLAEAVTLSGRVGEVVPRRRSSRPARPTTTTPARSTVQLTRPCRTGQVQRRPAARAAGPTCAWSPPTPRPVPSPSTPPEPLAAVRRPRCRPRERSCCATWRARRPSACCRLALAGCGPLTSATPMAVTTTAATDDCRGRLAPVTAPTPACDPYPSMSPVDRPPPGHRLRRSSSRSAGVRRCRSPSSAASTCLLPGSRQIRLARLPRLRRLRHLPVGVRRPDAGSPTPRPRATCASSTRAHPQRVLPRPWLRPDLGPLTTGSPTSWRRRPRSSDESYRGVLVVRKTPLGTRHRVGPRPGLAAGRGPANNWCTATRTRPSRSTPCSSRAGQATARRVPHLAVPASWPHLVAVEPRR